VESLIDFIRAYADSGEQIAVRTRRGYRMQGWSYSRIVQAANALAWEIAARGVKKGDAVLLWGPNSADWIVAFFGCLLCGAVVVPIDQASTAEFATRICREVDAKLVFSSSADATKLTTPAIFWDSLGGAYARGNVSRYPSPRLSRHDTVEIIFTSGTTAEPRGVVISHGNVLANLAPIEAEVQKYLRYEKLVHPLRFLNLLPLSHVFGQMLGIFIPPLVSGTVVFVDSSRPADFAETIRGERISVVVTVPRFLQSLQREIERSEQRDGRLDCFRLNYARAENENVLRRWWRFRRIHNRLGWKFWAFISGGATLPKETETFWNRLGYAVIQGYGMTETTSLVSLNHPFRSSNGSVGKVFHGVEMRVDGGGEILVRGENVASSYRQNGKTISLAEPDGWFRTGDLVETDENGRLYFKGRRKNVIVTSAGMKVYPEDLERALKGQRGVRDCVVVGVESDGDEKPHAAILLDGGGSDAASAVAAANELLAEYQKIRHWFIWPEPDFPRTPTQKPILAPIREAAKRAHDGAADEATYPDAVARTIMQITRRATGAIPESANIETDLHLTSLDRVELMSVLEERHQVSLGEVQFQEIATVGQLKKMLASDITPAANHIFPKWPQNRFVTSIRLAIYYLLAWPATYLLAAPRIGGRENLDGVSGPVLVVSNHVTYLDIAWVLPALPARIRNRLATAMGGERLARMRRPSRELGVFDRVLERLRYVLVTSLFNVFPLPQRSGFLKSFNFAGDLVDRGWSVLVFPEGQTTENGEMLALRQGIGLLAQRLNIPVLPIHLDGLFRLKREKRFTARPGEVRVRIGQPLRFDQGVEASEIARELELRLRELQST
jgi:long-chain acyl-CoA synthetase